MSLRQIWFKKKTTQTIQRIINDYYYYMIHHDIKSDVEYKSRMIKTDITRNHCAFKELFEYINVLDITVLNRLIMDYLFLEDMYFTVHITSYDTYIKLCKYNVHIKCDKQDYYFVYDKMNELVSAKESVYFNSCRSSLQQLFNNAIILNTNAVQLNTFYCVLIILHEYIKQIRKW